MQLELSDLRAVIALGDSNHFGRAAEVLGISQPALTKKIRQVEARLGGELFLRHPKGVTPTPAGALLCARAAVLLAEAADAEELTRRTLHGTSGTLRIGAGLTTLLSGLPDVLRAFRLRYPDVHVTVRDMSSEGQIAALHRGEIDVAFVRMPAETKGLEIEAVTTEELKIACNATLWPKTPRERRALYAGPFLIVSRASSATFHDHVLATCHAAGFTPRILQEADQLLTILTLVQSGLGFSLVPASARALRMPQVRILETVLPSAKWTIGMAWKSEFPVRHFLPLARRHWKAR